MENSENIFSYLGRDVNTKITSFKGYDLRQLLKLIQGYKLEYRNYLNIDPNSSIGCEIEFDYVKSDKLKPDESDDIEFKPGWILRSDASVTKGGEICSPVFYNSELSWQQFKEVVTYISRRASVSENCGSHVHIGAHALGEMAQNWNHFLNIWSVYENVIFRFCYGEYLNGRDNIFKYAFLIAKIIERYFLDMHYEYGSFYNEKIVMPFKEDVFRKNLASSRYQCVNLTNVGDYKHYQPYNTIEFRLANGSLNPIIWQNFINLYIHIINYSKSRQYDKDCIMRRKSILGSQIGNYQTYKDIHLEQALEFADLIFDKNIDKVYFLKQYFKDNSVTNKHKLVKSKKFTI